jgi:hypothetical protein
MLLRVSPEATVWVVSAPAAVEVGRVAGEASGAALEPIEIGDVGTLPAGPVGVGLGPPSLGVVRAVADAGAVAAPVGAVAGAGVPRPVAPLPADGTPLIVPPGVCVGRMASPFPPVDDESEPGAKPGCSRPAAAPVPADNPVGVGLDAVGNCPSVPIAGVVLAEEGGAPTVGMLGAGAGASVAGDCDERPLAPLGAGCGVRLFGVAGATKA